MTQTRADRTDRLAASRAPPGHRPRAAPSSSGREETLLSLGYPGGLRVLVAVPAAPDRMVTSDCGLRALRPLAVRLSNKPAAFDCSVLGTSRTGPRRVGISLAQALRLCAAGVHTVLCTE